MCAAFVLYVKPSKSVVTILLMYLIHVIATSIVSHVTLTDFLWHTSHKLKMFVIGCSKNAAVLNLPDLAAVTMVTRLHVSVIVDLTYDTLTDAHFNY